MNTIQKIKKRIKSFGITEEMINYNGLNRDTMGFAVKCSSITIDNGSTIDNGDGTSSWEKSLQTVDVFKNPITDPGKKSKKGKVTTLYNPETKEYIVAIVDDKYPGFEQALETVFLNGEILTNISLDEIRNNAE